MASAGVVSVALRLMGARQMQQAAAAASGALQGVGRAGAAATKELQAAQGAMMATARAGAMMTAAGAGMGYAMARAAKTSGEFAKIMAIVGKTSKSTTEDLEKQRDAAMRAGIDTQFSPTEAAKGMQVMAQAGISARGQVQMLIPVLDLAAAGQISVAEAASTTNRVLSIYGKTTADAAQVNDLMLGTTTMLDIGMQDMANAIGKTAGKTKQLGQTFETTLLMLGLGNAALGDINLASTANSSALTRMMTNEKAKQNLDKLGIKTSNKKTNTNRQVVDIILDLDAALEGVAVTEADRIRVETLGARGMGAYQAVVAATATVVKNGKEETLRGADAIRVMRERQKELIGTTAGFREALKQTYAGKVIYMMGSFETLIINIGQTFEKVLGPVIDAATHGLNMMIAVVRALPEPFKTTAAAVALMVSALLLIGGGILGTLGAVGLAIAGIGAGVGSFPAVFAAGKAAIASFATGAYAAIAPLLPVILAVGAAIMSVALVVGLLYEYNRKGLLDISGAWQAFTDYISELLNTAISFWSEAWQGFMDFVFSASSIGWQKIIKFMNAVLSKIMHMIGGLVDTYGELLFALGYEQEAAALRGLRDDLKGFDADVAAMAKTINEDYVKPAIKMAKSAGAAALDLGKEIATNTMEGFGEAIDGLKHMAGDMLGGVADVADEIGEKIKKKMNEAVESGGATKNLPGAGGGGGFDMDNYAKQERAKNQAAVQARRQQRGQETMDRQMGGISAAQGLAAGNPGQIVAGIAAAAGAAFGPLGGAVVSLADTLIGASREGKKFKEDLARIFTTVAQALNPVFKSLRPLLEVFEVIGELFGMVVEVLFAISLLQPALAVVAFLFQGIALVIKNLMIGFREFYIGLLTLIDWIPGIDMTRQLRELAAAQRQEVRERDELIERMRGEATLDEQRARRDRELAAATREATSAMLNVPSGYKVARAGFGAEVPVMDDFLMRPGQGAVEFSPDDTIIGVKETGGLGGPTIVIQNLSVNADNPTSFIRELMNVVGGNTLAGGVALGGSFQGRP